MIARLDITAARELVLSGFLKMRQHPTAPLVIWNYSEKCVYEKHWNEITMACRGLITDVHGKIVARPFPKFFGVDEWRGMGNEIPDEPFEVFEKLDGSLGILYWVGHVPQIATRGSFDGEQAREAMNILAMKGSTWSFHPAYTYLFEILYKANRIVVDYADRRELVLLAVIETETGEEVGGAELQRIGNSIGFTVARRFDGVTDFDSIMALGGANEEGFVVRFASGLRLKIKLAEYVRLHRLMTGVTPRKIWELLSTDHSIEELIQLVPEEFAEWCRGVARDLRSRYAAIEGECLMEYARMGPFPGRKEAALHIVTRPYPAVLFKMLDKKPYANIIWDLIYPPAASAFKGGGESE